MKIKRIAALVLIAALLATTAFAADFTYGSSRRYTKTDIVGLAEKFMNGLDEEQQSDGESVDGGFAYISADAFVLGGGYIMFPTKVEIREGDTAAAVLMRAMSQSGISGRYDGTGNSDFYLRSLNGAVFTPQVEPELEEWLADVVTYYEPDSWNVGVLGEYDITDMSGWMFFYNGDMPMLGMSEQYVCDGDVINIRFSLAGGLDIGGAGFDGIEPFCDMVDLDAVTRAIADGRLSYLQCEEIINRAGVTQGDIDELTRNL